MIIDRLFEVQDIEYADFQSKLTPTVPREQFIGVRVPVARKLAKEFIKGDEANLFFMDLPHKYFDENLCHALMISEIKDFNRCIKELELFLPYIDNWAVCDVIAPNVFKKNKPELIGYIKKWAKSEHTYTCRFGIGMLLKYFLDDDFEKEFLEIPANIVSDEYYVNMMIAWYYATALAKQWKATIPYIENNRLPVWVHNKTIQKARESYRISQDEKAYLKKYCI